MTDEIVSNADSKGVTLDYLTGDSSKNLKLGIFGKSPSFDPKEVQKIIANDPTVRAAIITVADKVFEAGWRIEKSSGKRDKKAEEKFKSLRFDKLMRKVIFNLLLYNNSFVEIRRPKKAGLRDLNLLETTYTKIDTEDNGDLMGYYQEVTGSGDDPYWKPKEVTHYKIDEYTTNVWADMNIEALYETVLVKDYARQWLRWFFGTNQLRPIFNIQGANEKKVKEFISYLKKAERQLNKPLLIEGELTMNMLQSFADEGKTVLELMEWCDQQILMLLQVPPISVGKADNSGRSNSVEQNQSLYTRVYSIQKMLEDENSYDLFPKCGYNDYKFIFGILDESVMTRVFENAEKMRRAQFTEEAILEYLKSQGVVFETKKVLKDDDDLAQMSNKELGTGNEAIKGNKSADAAPSRERQSSGGPSEATTVVKNSDDSWEEGFPIVHEKRFY